MIVNQSIPNFFPRVKIPPRNSFFSQGVGLSTSKKQKLPAGHRYYQDCFREGWARWIEWGINVLPSEDVWFDTKTFKKEESCLKAIKLRDKWLGRLRKGFEDRFKPGLRLRWICAMTLQKRGVVHFHLLICGDGLNLLSRKRWEHRWESMDRNSGYCRIYEADKRKSPRYLVREITKEGEVSWGGLWRGLNTPGAVGCCGERSNVA